MRVEELNQVIDQFTPTDIQKHKMLTRILNHNHEGVSRTRNKFKLLLITTIIVLFSSTTFAISNLHLFKEIYDENIDLVKDHILTPIVAAENEQFKLTLEGVLSDPYSSMFILSVEAFDEQSLKALQNHDLQFFVSTDLTGSQAYSVEQESELTNYATSNKKYYSLGLINVDPFAQEDVQISVILGGTELAVTAPTNSTIPTINIEVDQNHYENANYIPRSMIISPLSVTVEGIEKVLSYQIPNPSVVIHFSNGTTIDVFNQKTGFTGSRFPEVKVTTVSARFEKIIDINNIKSVIIDGREYPILK